MTAGCSRSAALRSERRAREGRGTPAVLGYVHSHLALADSGWVAFCWAPHIARVRLRCAGSRCSRESARARAFVPNIERALSFLEGHSNANRGHVALLEAHLAELEDVRGRGAIQERSSAAHRPVPALFRRATRGSGRAGGGRSMSGGDSLRLIVGSQFGGDRSRRALHRVYSEEERLMGARAPRRKRSRRGLHRRPQRPLFGARRSRPRRHRATHLAARRRRPVRLRARGVSSSAALRVPAWCRRR